MTVAFLHRSLVTAQVGGHVLLDAMRSAGGEIVLVFAGDLDPAALGLPDEAEIVGVTEAGSGRLFRIAGAGDGPLTVTVDGIAASIPPTPPETALFAGTHAIAAVRNGESAAIVLDWLRFHASRHGMTAALILDRARPGSDPAFAEQLRDGLAGGIAGLDRAVLLDAAQPLGKPGLPSEAHPYCVKEAPGKARMALPAPDPWHAPLGADPLYEILRRRFLAEARAVANIDVHDLLDGSDGRSVFDAAVAAGGGVVALLGRACYPWRLRPGTAAGFGDHICVQFDSAALRRRWCVAPAKLDPEAAWRMTRIRGADGRGIPALRFHRHMLLRHRTEQVAEIVPKTALVEHPSLVAQAKEVWRHNPVRMPKAAAPARTGRNGRRAIVTTMKDEGPFILEWLAHHRAIGFDDILVYTNDCSDGTDAMLSLLADRGLCHHRDNPYRGSGMKPQHAALLAAADEPAIRDADWVTCIDVDEFINIKTGDGTLDALFAAVPDANLISMTWRLFGNSDVHGFRDVPVTRQFTRAAPELCRKPHQAWGFKTLFRNFGFFRKLGVHRPKGLNQQLWEEIRWVNGSGRPLPREMYRNAWRSTLGTYGYDLVQLNHYAVRSAESFLVKRARGRVNHTDRDQGLAYWFRMNNNAGEETSFARHQRRLQAELDRLLADPGIAAAHARCVACHREKIAALRADVTYARFYADLTGPRMEKLSRMHARFGANVFLRGPDAVPDELLEKDPGEGFFFTVARGAARH